MEQLKEYVTYLVKSISKDPEHVSVTCEEDTDSFITVKVTVSESDMGAVIGKSGRTASSIRTLVIAYAYLHELGKLKISFEAEA